MSDTPGWAPFQLWRWILLGWNHLCCQAFTSNGQEPKSKVLSQMLQRRKSSGFPFKVHRFESSYSTGSYSENCEETIHNFCCGWKYYQHLTSNSRSDVP